MHENAVPECHTAEANLSHAAALAPAARLSAVCSAAAAGPRCDRAVVERRDRHHLAHGRGREGLLGPWSSRRAVHAFLDLVAHVAGELDHSRTGHAGQDAELERGCVERALAPPPDVRRRPSSTIPPRRRRLRRRRRGVSPRPRRPCSRRSSSTSTPGEQPRLLRADAPEGDQADPARAGRRSGRASDADERERSGRRRPDEAQHRVGRPGGVERLSRELVELEPVTARQADALGRAASRSRCSASLNGVPP